MNRIVMVIAGIRKQQDCEKGHAAVLWKAALLLRERAWGWGWGKTGLCWGKESDCAPLKEEPCVLRCRSGGGRLLC